MRGRRKAGENREDRQGCLRSRGLSAAERTGPGFRARGPQAAQEERSRAERSRARRRRQGAVPARLWGPGPAVGARPGPAVGARPGCGGSARDAAVAGPGTGMGRGERHPHGSGGAKCEMPAVNLRRTMRHPTPHTGGKRGRAVKGN